MEKWYRQISQPSRFDIIKYAVNDYAWQRFRLSLKGISTQEKLSKLRAWLDKNGNTHAAYVQVDNYLGALKRGGQISASGEVLK